MTGMITFLFTMLPPIKQARVTRAVLSKTLWTAMTEQACSLVCNGYAYIISLLSPTRADILSKRAKIAGWHEHWMCFAVLFQASSTPALGNKHLVVSEAHQVHSWSVTFCLISPRWNPVHVMRQLDDINKNTPGGNAHKVQVKSTLLNPN